MAQEFHSVRAGTGMRLVPRRSCDGFYLLEMGDTSPMNDTTQNVNVGLVGSLTMTFLCIAVTILCISFYRRYKRMQNRQDGTTNDSE